MKFYRTNKNYITTPKKQKSESFFYIKIRASFQKFVTVKNIKKTIKYFKTNKSIVFMKACQKYWANV